MAEHDNVSQKVPEATTIPTHDPSLTPAPDSPRPLPTDKDDKLAELDKERSSTESVPDDDGIENTASLERPDSSEDVGEDGPAWDHGVQAETPSQDDRDIEESYDVPDTTKETSDATPEENIEGATQESQSIHADTRSRSDSRSTATTQPAQRSSPLTSAVFVINALDAIGASKEAKRSKELEDTVQQALFNLKQSDQHPIDPEVIFRPLQLASKTFSIPLQVTALDCIGKLITYSYFAFPSEEAANQHGSDQPPLIERAIETICDCFENESTPIEIQQQIIKSLLAAVLNDKIVVHGAGLLKAVRQIYNIFIYSKSSQNQQIAQGSLTQMVGTVYDRVRIRIDLKEARLRDAEHRENEIPSPEGSTEQADENIGNEMDPSVVATPVVTDHPVVKDRTEKLTLQSFESSKDEAMVNDNAPTMVTRVKAGRKAARSVSGEEPDVSVDEEEDEIYVKDSFLVFRALCKLSHKILSHDQQQDLKSQNMRSKLLSLHLIQHLLNNHMAVFISPLAAIKNSASSSDAMTLLQAVKPHLCLSLSRNGASSVPRVFEVCCEIFWLMMKNMRVMMKVGLIHPCHQKLEF